MENEPTFRTARLTGRPPAPGALQLYTRLFGAEGEAWLDQDIMEWTRHQVAPWTLAHAGHDVGVGGFRIGFGDDGLEVAFHFLPEVWGHGLASEFLNAALDDAQKRLREDRFFARVALGNSASVRVMEKAGFIDSGLVADSRDGIIRLMRLATGSRRQDRSRATAR